ncbi:hypothetical protein [Alishewanella tabrizica]|uniref:Uncharacterized protein n=1 Tax=Alishewanella tabrizica TaxID=671278 RepID=A0ABQ2WUP6_9ALTE|nr:hypothetical protein [Alishewanella tabrizica]GGW73812.1 hypothetical protein GCM10008111_32110 [Alishewanella tabrizica]
MSSVPEKDWKRLSGLKEVLLNSACETIFRRIEQISSTRKDREHETYLELWKLINKEDEAIAEMFNDLKRSNAVFKIAALKHYGVLTDEQLAQYSQETQEQVARLCEYRR